MRGLTSNTVELISTLGALSPRGGPVQNPVLAVQGAVCWAAGDETRACVGNQRLVSRGRKEGGRCITWPSLPLPLSHTHTLSHAHTLGSPSPSLSLTHTHTLSHTWLSLPPPLSHSLARSHTRPCMAGGYHRRKRKRARRKVEKAPLARHPSARASART